MPAHPPAAGDEVSAPLREFAEARTRARRRRGIVLLALLLVLTLLVASGSWWLASGRWRAVPPTTGMEREQVVQVVAAEDLSVAFSQQWSESVPRGEVISTEPASGERVLLGSELLAVVSRGPERFTVPELVGREQAEAASRLAGEQLVLGQVEQAWHEEVAAGVVTAVGTDAGERVRRGTAVDLVVSRGPRPIEVEDFAGSPAATAVAQLEEAGLTTRSSQEHSREVAEGEVISQSPADGTLHRGEEVALVVSLGPRLVTVPNVQRMGVDAATTTLEREGFEVRTEPVETNYLGLGFVASADPGFATEAPEGSTITLYLV